MSNKRKAPPVPKFDTPDKIIKKEKHISEYENFLAQIKV